MLGADHTRSTYSNLGTVTGKRTGFNLGYLVGTGDADLILSVNYANSDGSGTLTNGSAASVDADTFGLGVAWRQRINASLDYTFSYGSRPHQIQGGLCFLGSGPPC